VSLPKGLLENVKSSLNIVDVIGESVVLKKSGHNYVGLCPFHQERSPSFSVNETKQLYHCYGCKKGGDLVSFVMDLHGLSFPEAIRDLAERGGLKLSSGDKAFFEQNSEASEKKQAAYRLNRFVAEYFRSSLKNTSQALTYLEQRGLSQETLQTYYVGYAPLGWDGLVNHLKDAKAPEPLAMELGLIRQGQKTGGKVDFFRGRVMFPITDTKGRILAFGGRVLKTENEPTTQGQSQPKYLNSSESAVFHKSQALFGLHQAHKYIREVREVVIVEGYFDVLALYQRGICNVVATCGTALTKEHLLRLSRLADRITILFDGDDAGYEAMRKSLDIALDAQILLHAVRLPRGFDPDEMVFDAKAGKEKAEGVIELKKSLSDAEVLLDQSLNNLFASAHKSLEAKSHAIQQAKDWLDKLKDPITRRVRIEYLFKTYGIEPFYFGIGDRPRSEVGSRLPQSNKVRPENGLPQPQSSAKGRGALPRRASQKDRVISPLEKVLVAAILLGQATQKLVSDELSNLPVGAELAGDAIHPVLASSLESLRGGQSPSGADFEQVQDAFFKGLLAEWESFRELSGGEFIRAVRSAGYTEQNIKLAVRRLVLDIWARFSHEVKMRLDAAERSKNKDLEAILLKEYLDVKKRMKELSHFYDKVN